MDQCFLCGSSENTKANPLIRDVPLHPELSIHFQCFISEAFTDWCAEEERRNPAFARYWDQMTEARSVSCPNCDLSLRRSPKAIGMGAGCWDACCDTCGERDSRGLSVYERPEICRPLEALRQEFNIGRDLDSIWDKVLSLAERGDQYLTRHRCKCGGRFSLAAFPRCPRCRSIVVESAFHVVYVSYETTRPPAT